VFDLKPGDVVVKFINPVKGGETGSPCPRKNWVEDLCQRMEERGKEPLVIEVRRSRGTTERVEVEAVGFQFGETSWGTTDPDTPLQTFT